MSFDAWMQCVSLALVSVAALLHVNGMNGTTPAAERLGFVLIAAAAAGSSAEVWWPVIETRYHAATFLHAGLGLVAVDVVLRHVRALPWKGIERRKA